MSGGLLSDGGGEEAVDHPRCTSAVRTTILRPVRSRGLETQLGERPIGNGRERFEQPGREVVKKVVNRI